MDRRRALKASAGGLALAAMPFGAHVLRAQERPIRSASPRR